MSKLQSRQKDLRFLKRKSLEEESRIISNYYSDLLRQYGVDCIYQKLDTSIFGNYKGIVDQNVLLQHAYGQDITPDYSCSAEMVTFFEVQTDIFQLQKFGKIPQTELDFYFDNRQFACDLAVKCGQLKEYPIDDIPIACEVPDCDVHIEWRHDDVTGADISGFVHNVKWFQNPATKEMISGYADDGVWPYELGLGYNENYSCGVLDGKLKVTINGYVYGQEHTVICDPTQISKFKVEFPKNSDLYRSLTYTIADDTELETLIFLTFTVERTASGIDSDGQVIYKNILNGTIHGSVLFYDINKIGKYLELIHPEVGDLITIDFPDEQNREKYEITDCYNKSLQSDGISPLLHNYVWKCKARRYVGNYDDVDESLGDKQIEEKIKHDQTVQEEIVKKISIYDEGDQEAYGGYDSVLPDYDEMMPDPYKHQVYEYLEDPKCLDIMRFGTGARLVTDGYDLIFITAPEDGIDGTGYVIARSDPHVIEDRSYFESGLRWIKATEDKIVFINILGEANTLFEDPVSTNGEIQICLNDLNEKTLDPAAVNKDGDNFLKFKGCRSYLWASKKHLYAKLQSNSELCQLI